MATPASGSGPPVSEGDETIHDVSFKRWQLTSPFDREIARLAVPALGTLIAEPLYVLVDTAIVGRIGTDELAGLALASTVLLSIHSLVIFLAYGTTATVARLVGGGNHRRAAAESVQGFWLAAMLGVAFALLARLFDRSLLEMLGGSGAPLEAGLRYLRISLIGLPFLLLSLAGAGAFNGRQDTKTPLRIAVVGALTNLIIELVLILGLGYGIGASALATVIAQVGVGLVFAGSIFRWAKQHDVSLAPDFAVLRRIALAGQALVMRSIALRGSFTLAAAVAARIGVVELAAHQIGTQIWMTIALGLDAVAIAGQALTGHWLGAGDATRAKAAASRMIEVDVVFAVVTGLVVLAFRGPVAAIFSTDPGVVTSTGIIIVWIVLMSPVSGYVFALDGILIGAGDLAYLGKTMALAAVAFALMAATVLNLGASLSWLWAALSVFMVLRAFFLRRRFRSDRWVVLGD